MKSAIPLMLSLVLPSGIVRPIDLSQSRYWRQIVVRGSGESCAVLDANVLAHAAPSLKDLRLTTPASDVPYTITLSEPAQMTADTVPVVQIHSRPASLVFDLQMPDRSYTDVDLNLQQHDFVLTATVSGTDDLTSSARTPLGTFTLFDLTARHLSRNTVLPLQESSFRYLHVELHGDRIAPEMIRDADVPPSREAQTVYTTVMQSFALAQHGTETIATFHVPAHVPLERVSIQLSPGFNDNFNRRVRVTGRTGSPGDPTEVIDGAITRVRLGKVQNRQMSFPAVMGVNLQRDATVEVAIENENDAPLPVSSVSLEMRQRSICFDSSKTSLNLFYGDPDLSAPAPAPVAQESSPLIPLVATLGPETRNPAFQERKDTRSLSDRGPDLMWLLLFAGLGVMGMTLHTLRRR